MFAFLAPGRGSSMFQNANEPMLAVPSFALMAVAPEVPVRVASGRDNAGT